MLPGDGVLPSLLVLSLTPLFSRSHQERSRHTKDPSLNTDLSVAPEIAQLADPFVPVQHAAAVPRTDGRIAGDLAELAATPQRWWDLVRFDPAGPVRIPVPGAPGTWLLVLPPAAAADCDCQQATALAGEAVETPGRRPGATARGQRPLRPGRVRVHGTAAPHRLRAAGPGYSVTLHWGTAAPVLNKAQDIILERARGSAHVPQLRRGMSPSALSRRRRHPDGSTVNHHPG